MIGPRLSLAPRGLLVAAVGLAAAFLVLHGCGLREEMRFLSGTPANVTKGMLYGAFYFVFVLVVPPLVMAAAVLGVMDALGGTENENENENENE